MIDDHPPVFRIGVERVGIIAEAGDGDAALRNQLADGRGPFVRQIAHIDVADAGIAAIRTARRPAHELDAAKPFVRREGHDLFQRQIAENGTDETKLHEPPRNGWIECDRPESLLDGNGREFQRFLALRAHT